MSTKTDRRTLLKLAGAGVAAASLSLPSKLFAQDKGELTIAYNVNLPSWDPTTGPSAVNPTIQGLYQSVFDQFILQKPDLSFAPGLLTEWGWSDDKKQIHMTVRDGVT
ncbi:MAG: twin-arginine translocation signal domain-containing protein, partial [Mesorhizobium sp.]|nr:twin-arginine translocation signal domain-containing protein [Mesorhizobium sp.]